MSSTQKANLRLLRREAGLLNRMLGDGAFLNLSEPLQRGRILSLRWLYQNLAGVIPEASLRKILAGACALVLGLSAACSDDDKPAEPDTGVSTPDTGLDLKVADRGADVARPDALKADMARADAAQLDLAQSDLAQPDLAQPDLAQPDMAQPDLAQPDLAQPDLDQPDASTIGHAAFKKGVKKPWGFVLPPIVGYSDLQLALGDLDGDGDLDLVLGGSKNTYPFSYTHPQFNSLFYCKNIGTKTVPKLAAPGIGVYGVNPHPKWYITPDLADIDSDGDLDMFIFCPYCWPNQVLSYQNTGTKTAPKFAAMSSSAFAISIPSGGFVVGTQFVDIDGDGDLDFFIADSWPISLKYFENTGTKTAPKFAAPASKKFGLPAKVFPAMVFMDLDGDGDLDLLAPPTPQVGPLHFSFYQNTGTKTAPKFAAPAANSFGLAPSGVPNRATLALGDMDGDGDLDIVRGDGPKSIIFYENTRK